MKKIFFLPVFFFIQHSLVAQYINLSGTIKSSSNVPIEDVEVKLVNANISTTTDNFGKFNLISPVSINNHELSANSRSYFDGYKLYLFSQDQVVFVDIYDISGRKITSILSGEKLRGTFIIYPAAYLKTNEVSVILIRVIIDDEIQSYKAVYSRVRWADKGLQEISSIKNNEALSLLKSGILALDELVCEHDKYETRRHDISSYKANLGTIFMDKILFPNTPSGLIVTAVSESQINISWNDNSDNETGFEIERSMYNTNNWSQITTVESNTVTYENTGLSPNTTYYYKIRAYNSAGNSNYSSSSSAKTHLGLTVPAPPSSLTVEATSPTSCKLKWTDNSSNETRFIIERQHLTISGFWQEVAYVDENITTYTHTGINETWPEYRIKAFSGLSSSPSNVASAPAKLRIVNDLQNFSDMSTYNQLVRVRIGPTEESVVNSGTYERLQPSETVNDISTVNTISPGYTDANSSLYYEDYSVEEAWNYSNYWVYIQCGWWDYIVVYGPPYYWKKTMTIAKCSDGVNQCYKNAWTNIYNHYSGYFVLKASDLLPHFNWKATKSSNSTSSIDAKTWNNK